MIGRRLLIRAIRQNKRLPQCTSAARTVNSNSLSRHRSFVENGPCIGTGRALSTDAKPVEDRKSESSTSEKVNEEKQHSEESFEETIHRLNKESSESDKTSSEPKSDVWYNIKQGLLSAQESVQQTWQEMINSGKAKGINQRVRDSRKKREKYTGPVALVAIDESEHLGAWDKMQRRLSEAPIIQSILGASHDLIEKSGAKELKRKAQDLKHDAEEAWETSQNPWVYRISSVYDTVTAETEFAVATRILQKLDPGFTMEQFKHDAIEHTIPDIMKFFLRGQIEELEPWLGEAVHQRLSAEIDLRKKEGLTLDDNILGIFNADILAVELGQANEAGDKEPILLLHFMCQQINCARNKEGEVVEGKEDEIKANSYLVAFQREYDEHDGELHWKIVDFRFNGAIAWI